MSIRVIPISQQATGAFNGGQIIENKPVGFPQDGGFVRPFSTLFYWARAEAVIGSTIGQHPHQGFEIMSFVLKGSIKHFDTKNNSWIPLSEGDVQIIRAGNGIEHAEHLDKGAVIFQIWFDPDLSKSLEQPATYDDYAAADFKSKEVQGNSILNYTGDEGLVKLETPVDIRRLKLIKSFDLDIAKGTALALYMIDGYAMINGNSVEQDSFIIVENESSLDIKVDEPADMFIIELPVDPGYRTYAERSGRLR